MNNPLTNSQIKFGFCYYSVILPDWNPLVIKRQYALPLADPENVLSSVQLLISRLQSSTSLFSFYDASTIYETFNIQSIYIYIKINAYSYSPTRQPNQNWTHCLYLGTYFAHYYIISPVLIAHNTHVRTQPLAAANRQPLYSVILPLEKSEWKSVCPKLVVENIMLDQEENALAAIWLTFEEEQSMIDQWCVRYACATVTKKSMRDIIARETGYGEIIFRSRLNCCQVTESWKSVWGFWSSETTNVLYWFEDMCFFW